MTSLVDKFLDIPGIKKIAFQYKRTQDFIFFLIVVAVPSSFFALVPKKVFYDLKLFFFLISMVYIVFYFKYLKKITKLPAGVALIVLILYLLFELFYSLFIHEIPLAEVAAIFRANFFYPISTLAFLLYVSEMDNNRIYRFLYWLFLATLFQGFLYIVSNLTGIDIFATGARAYDFQGAEILQNMFAIPHYNEVVFIFGFLAALTITGFNKHWIWFIPLIVTIISIVRSEMIVYGIALVLILVLSKFSGIKLNFSKILKIILLSLSFIVLIFILFPSHVNRVIDKFGIDKKEQRFQKSYTESGTYALRLRIIEDAYVRTKRNDNLFLGNGYHRVAKKGEYDFVVGSDTLIAPVIYTEGFVGLFLRILPLLILLLYAFKILKSPFSKYKIFGVLIMALIIPEFINAVQTKFFVYYTRDIFIIYLLSMIIYNDQKKLKHKKEKNVA